MKSHSIEIVEFIQEYQTDIESFIDRIRTEFSEPISSKKSLSTVEITEFEDKYLVALANKKAVGTCRLTILKNNNAVLRRMFLDKYYRGQGIANLLLETITNWAIENEVKAIYLGTMSQFEAAQSFYKNNGFKEVALENLPIDFPFNPVDSIFYMKNIFENKD